MAIGRKFPPDSSWGPPIAPGERWLLGGNIYNIQGPPGQPCQSGPDRLRRILFSWRSRQRFPPENARDAVAVGMALRQRHPVRHDGERGSHGENAWERGERVYTLQIIVLLRPCGFWAAVGEECPRSQPCSLAALLLPPPSRSEYASHRKKVHSVAWNCLGTRLASGSVDMAVRVWTIDESGRATDVELKGHTDSVDQLRWDPRNADLLGTASGDKTVC